MTKRILLHPGFHKTGTTTLQRGLHALRDVLKSDLEILLAEDIRPATLISRSCSADPSDKALAKFSGQFAACLSILDSADPRPLLISAEALAGQIPGRRDITSYSTAPELILRTVRELKAFYGFDADVTVWFTTRSAEAWMRSVHYQNVRSDRVTESFESYAPKLTKAARLEDVVSETRRRLTNFAEVTSARLEDIQNLKLGLLDVALEQLDVASPISDPLTPQNVRPDGGLEALLALNRSDLSEDDLKNAKNDLLKQFRKKTRKSAKSKSRGTSGKSQ